MGNANKILLVAISPSPFHVTKSMIFHVKVEQNGMAGKIQDVNRFLSFPRLPHFSLISVHFQIF